MKKVSGSSLRSLAPLILQPFGQTPVEIRYFPSSIETLEEATITLENPAVGSWVYNMEGKGHAPRDAKEVTVVSQVQRPATTTITFKNPFLEAIQALVVLETQAPKNVFSLLNKKARLPVAPLGSCQIPVPIKCARLGLVLLSANKFIAFLLQRQRNEKQK